MQKQEKIDMSGFMKGNTLFAKINELESILYTNIEEHKIE